MNTPPENEFTQLRRLLSLKRRELPPAGYFQELSGSVISVLQAQQHEGSREGSREKVPSWILSFVELLQARPAFAGAFGAVACAVLVGAVVFYEQDSATPRAMPSLLSEITPPLQQDNNSLEPVGVALQPVSAGGTPLMAGTNLQLSPRSTLFDAIPGLDTVNVGHNP